MSNCSNGRCSVCGNEGKKKTFWTFCNIKTIIAAGIAIYWLVTELL